MSTDNTSRQAEQRASKSLMITMGIVVLVVGVIAIIGFLFLNHPDELVEGQVEGTTVRVSGKLPGRVLEFYVEEGDSVKEGDTIVHIHSAMAEAQLTQAEAPAGSGQSSEPQGGCRYTHTDYSGSI